MLKSNLTQAFNPFLPIDVYIPDGEPHVFGERVYLFGSHDKENGDSFCMLSYVFYSASIYDLTDWSCKGVSYEACQDPLYCEGRKYMYAPDVVQGKDGRYYLYYCLAGWKGKDGYNGPISVAVCDTPDGKYEYLGFVKNKDNTPMTRFVPFDPAVINDNGNIRLYYGTQYSFENHSNLLTRGIFRKVQSNIFNKSVTEIKKENGGIMGPVHVELADDMLTIVSEPCKIMPARTKGTQFENHPFFEASSIRKIGNQYYFIYSSQLNHELCYATSIYPDKDFIFRGTIISNGDIGYDYRKAKDRLNATGTTHGSIEKINNQWYVFYHRLTHKSDYSRQACADKIDIMPDGTINQVQMTSCGLNAKPLKSDGEYPAVICCNLTNGKMPHIGNRKLKKDIPYIASGDGEQFIKDVENNTLIGYKTFNFQRNTNLSIIYRGDGGTLTIGVDPNVVLGVINLNSSVEWKKSDGVELHMNGDFPLFLTYKGKGKIDIIKIYFEGENNER
jgi:hypothetical protein